MRKFRAENPNLKVKAVAITATKFHCEIYHPSVAEAVFVTQVGAVEREQAERNALEAYEAYRKGGRNA